VRFRLACATTEWGESLRLVGADETLGAWAPERACEMTCDEACYPAWLSSWIKLPCIAGHVRIAYKYVRDRRTSGFDFEWEEDIPNRVLELPAAPNSAWVVEDGVFGQACLPVVAPLGAAKCSTDYDCDSVSTCDISDDDSSCCSLGLGATAPEQTLVFLDFDDTLFPSSHLRRCGVPMQQHRWSDVSLSKAQHQALQCWSSALAAYFRAACASSGRVVVLSHASPGWIEACIRHFAPELENLIIKNPKVRVVYAAATGTSHFALSGSKHDAMWEEACGFYGHEPWSNIMSVGDMPYESDALRSLVSRRGAQVGDVLFTKIHTCQRQPTIEELTHRLTKDALSIVHVLQCEDNLDLGPEVHSCNDK